MTQQSSGVDPSKINFTDLTGQERVGVINRNTNERVSVVLATSCMALLEWGDPWVLSIYYAAMCVLGIRGSCTTYHTCVQCSGRTHTQTASTQAVSDAEKSQVVARGSPTLQRRLKVGTAGH